MERGWLGEEKKDKEEAGDQDFWGKGGKSSIKAQ